ncbi:MAG TPA: VTT domain-containing protein [Candidatus Nitrosotalea sp.]|nr:VTT domain-containing protein [Candidatus Nitrosotalea sp.]
MLGNVLHEIFNDVLFIKYGLVGLFFNGVFSSFIPIPTEITTTTLLVGGANPYDVFLALATGSILGGYVAYYLGYNGRLIGKFRKATPKYEQKSVSIMSKYGWSTVIFFSPWIPIIGDIVSIIAGTKKYNLWKYSVSMIAGKIVKSVAIVFFSVHFIHWLFAIMR